MPKDFLTCSGVQRLTSTSTIAKWVSAFVQYPDIMLTSTFLVSVWIDMEAGYQSDSCRTLLVRLEILSIMQRRIKDPVLRNDNTTLIGMLHIVAAELCAGNVEELQNHLVGVEGVINSHGGLGSLSKDGILANVAIA
jgi:hypothetical protein